MGSSLPRAAASRGIWSRRDRLGSGDRDGDGVVLHPLLCSGPGATERPGLIWARAPRRRGGERTPFALIVPPPAPREPGRPSEDGDAKGDGAACPLGVAGTAGSWERRRAGTELEAGVGHVPAGGRPGVRAGGSGVHIWQRRGGRKRRAGPAPPGSAASGSRGAAPLPDVVQLSPALPLPPCPASFGKLFPALPRRGERGRPPQPPAPPAPAS